MVFTADYREAAAVIELGRGTGLLTAVASARCSTCWPRARSGQVARTYPLTQAADALRYAESGSVSGKVILIPITP